MQLAKIVTAGVLGFISLTSYCQVPSTPIGLYSIANDSKNELYWTANGIADGVTSYNIYRSENKVTFALVANVPAATAPQYSDNGLINGKQYYYRITSINFFGESAFSIIDSGVPQNSLGGFISFNGTSSDSAHINKSNQLQLNARSFTIEFWIRIKTMPFPGNEGYIISRHTPANDMRYVVRLMPTGKIEFRITNVLFGVSTNTIFKINQWYHVAITYIKNAGPATNTIEILINGMPAAVAKSANIFDVSSSVNGKLIIGGDLIATNRYFTGYLDELRIWEHDRSQAQIAAAMCTRARGDEAGLVGLWHFDEDKSTIPRIYDYSRYGSNGSLNASLIKGFVPVAYDDEATTTLDAPVLIDVQSNDENFSATPKVTSALVNGYPLHGAATIQSDGSIRYVPSTGYLGTDVIKYQLADTAGYCLSTPRYDTATVQVIVRCNPSQFVSISNKSDDAAVCESTSAFFSVIATGFNLTYQWQKDGRAVTGATRSYYEIPVVSSSDAGVYTVTVSNECPSLATAITTLTVYEKPEIIANPENVTRCENQTATFMVNAGVTESPVYQWRKDGILIPGANSETYILSSVKGNDAGNFDVIVSGTCGSGITSDPASFVVNLKPSIITSPVTSQSLCQGSLVDITVMAVGNNLTYQWQKNGIDIAHAIKSTYTTPVGIDTEGIYTVVVSGLCPPAVISEPSVLISLPLPQVSAGEDKSIVAGGYTSLDGETQDGILYEWTPPLYMNNPTILQPMVSPLTDTEYTLNVTNGNGCSASDQVIVTLVTRALLIPNAFSPNNDGINDTWEISNLNFFPDSFIEVFNRYGECVFQSISNVQWNGTYKGSPLPWGTYHYIIRLRNDKNPISGWVEIVK